MNFYHYVFHHSGLSALFEEASTNPSGALGLWPSVFDKKHTDLPRKCLVGLCKQRSSEGVSSDLAGASLRLRTHRGIVCQAQGQAARTESQSSPSA